MREAKEQEDYEEMGECQIRGVGESNRSRGKIEENEEMRERERAYHNYSSRGEAVKWKRSSSHAAEPSTSELCEFLKSPIPRDDPDEIFALSLALKVQLLSMIVNWESQQNLHPTTPLYVHYISNTLPPHSAPYYYHPQSPNNSYQCDQIFFFCV